jgi:hypothetical protein
VHQSLVSYGAGELRGSSIRDASQAHVEAGAVRERTGSVVADADQSSQDNLFGWRLVFLRSTLAQLAVSRTMLLSRDWLPPTAAIAGRNNSIGCPMAGLPGRFARGTARTKRPPDLQDFGGSGNFSLVDQTALNRGA